MCVNFYQTPRRHMLETRNLFANIHSLITHVHVQTYICTHTVHTSVCMAQCWSHSIGVNMIGIGYHDTFQGDVCLVGVCRCASFPIFIRYRFQHRPPWFCSPRRFGNVRDWIACWKKWRIRSGEIAFVGLWSEAQGRSLWVSTQWTASEQTDFSVLVGVVLLGIDTAWVIPRMYWMISSDWRLLTGEYVHLGRRNTV
jgi:hypothetical protein